MLNKPQLFALLSSTLILHLVCRKYVVYYSTNRHSDASKNKYTHFCYVSHVNISVYVIYLIDKNCLYLYDNTLLTTVGNTVGQSDTLSSGINDKPKS